LTHYPTPGFCRPRRSPFAPGMVETPTSSYEADRRAVSWRIAVLIAGAVADRSDGRATRRRRRRRWAPATTAQLSESFRGKAHPPLAPAPPWGAVGLCGSWLALSGPARGTRVPRIPGCTALLGQTRPMARHGLREVFVAVETPPASERLFVACVFVVPNCFVLDSLEERAAKERGALRLANRPRPAGAASARLPISWALAAIAHWVAVAPAQIRERSSPEPSRTSVNHVSVRGPP